MKIITIVGIRGAGKTTVIEALLREGKARGKRVGTLKTVFCPAFHMDKPGSNTSRHTGAGAVLVTARAERETVFLVPRKLLPSEVLAHYDHCDWVLAEGDYELPVPRLVAAREEADALERVNSLTLAVTGRIADTARELKGLPVLHPLREPEALADLMEGVPDVKDLCALDQGLTGPDLEASRAFCAAGCKGHSREGSIPGVRVTVDGKPLTLTEEQCRQVRLWAAGEKETSPGSY